MLRLSQPVLEELHVLMLSDRSEETSFVLLGKLLVDAILGASEAVLSAQADRLMDEEKQFAGRASADFLFGCSYFDLLTATWTSLVRQFVSPATPELALIKDALLVQTTA